MMEVYVRDAWLETQCDLIDGLLLGEIFSRMKERINKWTGSLLDNFVLEFT